MRSRTTPVILIGSLMLAGLAATIVTSGCDDNGLTPNTVSVSPQSIQLAVTDPAVPAVCSVSTSALNGGGSVSGFSPTFTSSNSSVAAVQPSSNPSIGVVQAVNPGTATITISDPSSQNTQATVTVVANGITDLLQGGSTSEGFVGRVKNASLPTGPSGSPILSSTSINGTSGGTASLVVGGAVPLADILIGEPGQVGYLDIPVNGTPPNRQVSSILNGFNVTLNILAGLCQQQFAVSVVVEDAAGNFSQPQRVIVNLGGAGLLQGRKV